MLRYNHRDTTGGATTAGSYAFLRNASDMIGGDAGSAWLSIFGEGLLVHQTDAGGVSQSGFYGEVEVGDEFTAWVATDCWGHYEVTAMLADPPTPPRKRFAIESVTYADLGCGNTVETATTIEFRWGPPPALEVGTDGIPVMRVGQPVEGGRTYRVLWDSLNGLVIDVPTGMILTFTGGALHFGGTLTIGLEDVASGSILSLGEQTGVEYSRWIAPGTSGASGASGASGSASRDVGALFDAIVSSVTVGQATP